MQEWGDWRQSLAWVQLAAMGLHARLSTAGAHHAPYPAQSKFWLLTGFANQDSKLFADELEAVAAAYPDNMRWDCALSLEQTSARGEPLYVQVRLGGVRSAAQRARPARRGAAVRRQGHGVAHSVGSVAAGAA